MIAGYKHWQEQKKITEIKNFDMEDHVETIDKFHQCGRP